MRWVQNVFWLGAKELHSLFSDFVLLGLVVYSFSLAIYVQGHSQAQELRNASIGIVDEDDSPLSRQLARAFRPPYFKMPVQLAAPDVDHLMNTAAYTFVIVVPRRFEADVLASRAPALQVDIDATAMVQAGLGYGYIQQILATETERYLERNEGEFLSRSQGIPRSPVVLSARIAFNPNVETAWFTSVMGIVNNVTMLAIVLAGAAIVREREHGTMEHLLVMPISPFEIAASKVWANALVIAIAAALSLQLVVREILHIPIRGSVSLFIVGTVAYLFFATAIGIFLGTIARSMPQLGLLFMLVAMPLNILSGSNTPLEAMPALLRTVMMASPSTHFVLFAQSVLFRGATLPDVWSDLLLICAVGTLFFALALQRFRSAVIRNG